MQTISFYSYKGGCGRSLLLSNLAYYLASRGRTVFILDLDLEAPGLHFKFEKYCKSKEQKPQKLGFLNYLEFYLKNNKIPEKLDDFVFDAIFNRDNVFFMPAGNAPYPYYGELLRDTFISDFFYSEGKEFGRSIKFFLNLKGQIRQEYNPEYLLIDSRTGITEIGGIVTKVLPEILIPLLLLNNENKYGIREVISSVKNEFQEISIYPVLSRVPLDANHELLKNDISNFLNESLLERDYFTKDDIFILHSDQLLELEEEIRLKGVKSLKNSYISIDYINFISSILNDKHLYDEVEKQLKQLVISNLSDDKKYSVSRIKESVLSNNKSSINILRHRFFKSSEFDKLYNFLLKEFENKIGKKCKVIPVDEKKEKGVWDLYAENLYNGLINFCSEPYYLTCNRAQYVNVVKFGTLDSYTLFFHKRLLNKYQKVLKERPSLKMFVKKVIEINPDIKIITYGETAATYDFVSHLDLELIHNVTREWEKVNLETQMINKLNEIIFVLDHVVARDLAMSSYANCYVYYRKSDINTNLLKIQLDHPIDVGFPYANNDPQWGKKIAEFFLTYLIEHRESWIADNNDESIYNDLCREGIKPLKYKDLILSLLMEFSFSEVLKKLQKMQILEILEEDNQNART